jgi:prevent-host-death family protein
VEIFIISIMNAEANAVRTTLRIDGNLAKIIHGHPRKHDRPNFHVLLRGLNRKSLRVKEAANRGPVFITLRGRPTHVLLTVENYSRLAGKGLKTADMLAVPSGEDVEFDPPRLPSSLSRPISPDG